jgi:pimeloyl-ACP methyl ester carboxylesterase
MSEFSQDFNAPVEEAGFSLQATGRFPQDFPVPRDQGGPGQGQPIGGFGGDLRKNQSEHRAVVQSVGKAPVLLIHGNSGTADLGQWDMLDLKRMLMENARYPQELVWAPTYLGINLPGTGGNLDDGGTGASPHTNNVNEVREFIDNVCEYLGVDVVDIIAHSLGCTLTYSIFRGLEKRRAPVNWNQPKKWDRVGTFVALAGAFHGLGSGFLPFLSKGEWETGGEFIKELLAETLGGGGETPFGEGEPETPGPTPHNITYFCGVARGDFIDAQKRDTGFLRGATNNAYDLGPSIIGHEKIKENLKVFNDFLPLLNSVPPVPSVTMRIDTDSGDHARPLELTANIVDQEDKVVHFVANRVSKLILNGLLVNKVAETSEGTLDNDRALTLHADGMWEVVYSAEGAVEDEKKTYWVGEVTPIEVTIVADNFTFETSLDVAATTTRGNLYYSLDGVWWNEGDKVTIAEDAVVHFIAIDPNGSASEIVSRSFEKAVG